MKVQKKRYNIKCIIGKISASKKRRSILKFNQSPRNQKHFSKPKKKNQNLHRQFPPNQKYFFK